MEFTVFLREVVNLDAGMVVLAAVAVAATSRAAVEATSKVAAAVAAVALAAAMTVRTKSSAVHDSIFLGLFSVAD